MQEDALSKPIRYSHRRLRIDKQNLKHIINETQNSIPMKLLLQPTRLQSANMARRPNFDDLKRNNPKPLTNNNGPVSLRRRNITQQQTVRLSVGKQQKKQEQLKKEIENYCSDSNVLNNYQILSHIGKGSFAAVSLAIEKDTQKQFAVKIYQKGALKDNQKLQNIKRQIRSLKTLNHRNIINLLHVVSEKRKLFLIMEYAGRHSLEGLLRKKQSKRLPEQEAKRYFKQLLEALSCCHRHNISHRDVKPENILINESNNIKLIDFGFSILSKQKLTTFCGTPSYMAPEILSKLHYDGPAVDIWASGVLLYVLLYGMQPFRATNQKQLYRLIKMGKYQFKEDIPVSSGAKRVIGKILKVIPNQRCTADELLFDKWFEE